MSMSPFDPAALAARLQGHRHVTVAGLRGSAPAFVIASLLEHLDGPLLWIAADDEVAEHTHRELRAFLGPPGARRVHLVPASDVEPYQGMSPHAEIARRRIEILARLLDGHPDVVVASVRALLKRVVPRDVLGNAQELLVVGEEIDRDGLVASLVEWGYLSTDRTEDPGCFTVRGHVLDLFPPGFEAPLRLELWGDEIESLRVFDPTTQRSLTTVDEVVLLPVREEILEASAVERFAGSLKAISDERSVPPRQRVRIQQELEHGRYFAGIEDYLPLFHDDLDCVFDYLPSRATVVTTGAESLDLALEREPARVRKAYERGGAREALVPEPEELFLSADEFREQLHGHRSLALPELHVEAAPSRSTAVAQPSPRSGAVAQPSPRPGAADPGPAAPAEVLLPTASHATLRAEILAAREREGGMLTPLLRRLEAWHEAGAKVLLACSSRVQAERVGDLLRERDVPADALDVPLSAAALLDPDSPLRRSPGVVTGVRADLQRGFAFEDAGLVLLTQTEIFGARRSRRRAARRDHLGHALTSFSELAEGDYVVHARHGVGRYRGLHKIETPKSQAQKRQEFLRRARSATYRVGDADVGQLAAAGNPNDYLVLEYRGGDRLYVPVHKLDLLHRYAAVDGASPPLDRLGGTTWRKRRRKVEEAVQKLAAALLELYAGRETARGIAFDEPDAMYREFAASFPFDETEDQLEAIGAIQRELAEPRPMDRLVCGDVGYGKTEVALRAAFQVVASGHQVAVLVPTTILALQHYLSFQERLQGFPVRVEMISRLRGGRERRDIIRRTAAGEIDILIGTHALLGKEVAFRRLGLLVIDEEHRFGVRQKERIKELRQGVDVLAMTATPIPRTLNMALSGIRSFSLIDTPPQGRLEVRTHIVKTGRQRIRDAIEAELRRGGQVFFVHNRVRSIGAMERFLRKVVPGVEIGVAHGQMSERDLESVMVDFVQRKFQVLLCTTIIESGIDIPSCNTIIIHRADRLGLAQLYQLRGRVGRGHHRGYCYLLVPPGRTLTRDAMQRLKALQDNTSLGSGFKIASRDLEIRGAGNLLGKEQSGNVNAVGLHTYLEMLQEAVARQRGDRGAAPVPEIEVRTEAYIPADYIPDQRDRLLYYKRLSDAPSRAEALEILEELEDLYGRPPDAVERLVELIEVKVEARRLWISRVDPVPDGVRLTFHEGTPLDPARLAALVQRAGRKMSLSAAGELTVRLSKERRKQPLPILKRLLRRLS